MCPLPRYNDTSCAVTLKVGQAMYGYTLLVFKISYKVHGLLLTFSNIPIFALLFFRASGTVYTAIEIATGHEAR